MNVRSLWKAHLNFAPHPHPSPPEFLIRARCGVQLDNPGWGEMSFISTRLPGDDKAAGPRTTLWGPLALLMAAVLWVLTSQVTEGPWHLFMRSGPWSLWHYCILPLIRFNSQLFNHFGSHVSFKKFHTRHIKPESCAVQKWEAFMKSLLFSPYSWSKTAHFFD